MDERAPSDFRLHRILWFAGFAWITAAAVCTGILMFHESGTVAGVQVVVGFGSLGILCLVGAVAARRIADFDEFRLFGPSSKVVKAPVVSDGTLLQRLLLARDFARIAVDADGLRVVRRSDYGRACGVAFLLCCLLPTKAVPATAILAIPVLAHVLWLATFDRGACRRVTPIAWAQVRGVVETPSSAVFFFFEGAPMERMELTLNPAQRRGLMEAVGDRCPVMCLPTVAGPRTDLRRRKPAIHAWTARELDEALGKLRDLES